MRRLKWIDAWAAITSMVVICGFVIVCLLVWSLTAHGQPVAASQPVKAQLTKAALVKLAKAPAAKARVVVKVAPASAPLAHAALLTPASQPVVKLVAKPASQPVVTPVVVPASQPTPVASWRAWLRDNWRYLLFVIVLPSIITALKRKGVRDGLVGFLESVLERSSVTQPHNSFGTLKWPGAAAGPPVEPPKPPEPPKA